MTMKNILACRPGSYARHQNIAYSHLAEIGVQYVEIGLPAPDKVQETLNHLKNFGLSVSSTQGSLDVKNPNIAKDFAQTCELTRQLGANRIFVSVHAGEMERSTVYNRLHAVGETCARHNVTVIMETHPDMVTNGTVARQTMEGVHHPNIRVNWDTANVYFYNEGIDGIEEMKKVLDYIEGVHLKDTNGGYRTWYFPALGEGIVAFAEVFRVLNTRGFYGPFTMELEGIEGENLTEEGAKERVASSVRHLRNLGVLG
jgi:sugar phosphate isomerase/epimerase